MSDETAGGVVLLLLAGELGRLEAMRPQRIWDPPTFAFFRGAG